MRWGVYSAVVLATVLVALFRYTLDQLFGGESHVLLPFAIPVMLGAWYAGLRCGLFATVINTGVLAYFFAKPVYSFRVEDVGDQLRLELYTGICVFISLVSEARHRYLRQIEIERIHVARRQRELEIEVVERRAAEHRLQVSQTQFQLVTDHAPVMLAQCDRDLHYRFVNQPYAERFGLQPKDVVGKTIPEILGIAAYEKLRVHIDAVLNGQTVEFEFDIPDSSKQLKRVHCVYRTEYDDRGQVNGFLATLLDITMRIRAEASLRASERRYRALIQTTPQIVWTAGGTDTSATDWWVKLTGQTAMEAEGWGWLDAVHPDDQERVRTTWTEAYELKILYDTEYRIRTESGLYRHFCVRGVALYDAFGQLEEWVGTLTDIHEKKLAEAQLLDLNATLESRVVKRTAELQASEERFRAGMEGSLHSVFFLTAERSSDGSILDFRFTDLNQIGERMICRPRSEIIGQRLCELLPINRTGGFFDKYVRVVQTGEPLEEEFPMPISSGIEANWLHHFVVRVGDGIAITSQDVSARKLAEESMKASLHEKETLLKEIHHRVKNNLQIVSTLLDLQSGHTSDVQALAMFQESRGRVKSMALIHERLYRSQDIARVDFSDYVRRLADDLYHTYNLSSHEIELVLEIDYLPLSIDLAIPCGLLLNELMSNCFKHAFADVAGARLRIALHLDSAATNVLIVSDNGAGFPADTDFRNTTSFGLQLVNTLVDQLDGTIELTSDPGTTFTVRFPSAKK
jgi:PAS domain S-box-containing protein